MILYHYCSEKIFEDILSSKVLWLSDLTDLKKANDNEEVIRTFRILWQRVKQQLFNSDLEQKIVIQEIEILDRQYDIEIQIDSPYGCCFCQRGDELNQWQEYGDNTKGVVLGFDFDWFSDLPQHMPHPNSNIRQSIGYSKVLYDYVGGELEQNFYKICYDAIKKYGLQAWIMRIRPTYKHYSPFIKNPNFYIEIETRIVYYPDNQHDYAANPLCITGPIEKHYCLPWTRGNGDNALYKIGLGCNCKLTDKEVQRLWDEAGIKGRFELFHSECSYRLR